MWRKLVEWSNSSTSYLLIAGLSGIATMVWFGNYISKRIEESR